MSVLTLRDKAARGQTGDPSFNSFLKPGSGEFFLNAVGGSVNYSSLLQVRTQRREPLSVDCEKLISHHLRKDRCGRILQSSAGAILHAAPMCCVGIRHQVFHVSGSIALARYSHASHEEMDLVLSSDRPWILVKQMEVRVC